MEGGELAGQRRKVHRDKMEGGELAGQRREGT